MHRSELSVVSKEWNRRRRFCKGCVPSMHLLSLVVFHIAKTEIGTYLASNYLFQVCDFYNCLNDKKAHHAITVKLDGYLGLPCS